MAHEAGTQHLDHIMANIGGRSMKHEVKNWLDAAAYELGRVG